MTEARELRNLMSVLSVELTTWSEASRYLETVCGSLAHRASATPAEIHALQSLDQISQHLDQLARLCGDVGGDDAVRTAMDRLDLSDLKARLSRAEVTPTSTGEAELW